MPVHIITAFSGKNFGIGKNGCIPWRIQGDLKRFKDITIGGIVVMGRKTWDSLPNNVKPLPGRINWVVTSKWFDVQHNNTNNVSFMSIKMLYSAIAQHEANKDIFIIGGESLYKKFMSVAERIYATVIDKHFDCDVFFPAREGYGFDKFAISKYSESIYSDNENCYYRYIDYERVYDSSMAHGEYPYLDTLMYILQHGNNRPDRTGVGTRSVFATQMRFDVSRYIPMLTTKFVSWKSVLRELLWFLGGKTDSKILEDQGVKIWQGNTTRAFLDGRGLKDYKEGDIGPLYGFNWRHYGAEYKGCENDYSGQGFDQLSRLINDLKNDPWSRRHMITTFCPSTVDMAVLAPCHGIVTQFYVDEGNDGEKLLSCHTYCRSTDMFLGAPFNIASYTILLHLIAKVCDMKPKELVLSTGDTHIYSNHMKQVQEQLSRKPLPFPVLEVKDSVKAKTIGEWNEDDFELVGYLYHPSIKAEMAV